MNSWVEWVALGLLAVWSLALAGLNAHLSRANAELDARNARLVGKFQGLIEALSAMAQRDAEQVREVLDRIQNEEKP